MTGWQVFGKKVGRFGRELLVRQFDSGQLAVSFGVRQFDRWQSEPYCCGLTANCPLSN